MDFLTALPTLIAQIVFLGFWGLMIYLTFLSCRNEEKALAAISVAAIVGLHLIFASSGAYFWLDRLIDLPYGLYTKDLIAPAASLILAIAIRSSGFWVATIYSNIVITVALVFAMIVPRFLQF